MLYLAFAMLNATPYTLDSTHNVKKDGFLQGLILNISNPKAILFFIFLVTPFVDENIKLGLVALWCSLFAAFVFVILSANIARSYINAKTFYVIDRICGVLFAIFAWLLCFECGEIVATLLL